MSLFGLKTFAGILAAESRQMRRVSARQVQRGSKGFIPSLLGVAGRQARKKKQPK